MKNLTQSEKILQLMIMNPLENNVGRDVSVEEIKNTLGSEIVMSRISVYMFELKRHNIAIKSIKDGRNVVAYTLPNVIPGAEYLASKLSVGASVLIVNKAKTYKNVNQSIIEPSESVEESEAEEETSSPLIWIDSATGLPVNSIEEEVEA